MPTTSTTTPTSAYLPTVVGEVGAEAEAGKTLRSSSFTRRRERERLQTEVRHASLPPPGTPLTGGPLLALTRGLVGSVTALISILLLTFLLLAGANQFEAAGLDLFHPLQRPRLHRILGRRSLR